MTDLFGALKVSPEWKLIQFPTVEDLRRISEESLRTLKIQQVHWLYQRMKAISTISGLKFTYNDGTQTPNTIGLAGFTDQNFYLEPLFDCNFIQIYNYRNCDRTVSRIIFGDRQSDKIAL